MGADTVAGIDWKTIGILVAMLTAFSGVVLLAVKVIVNASQKHIDNALVSLSEGIEKNNSEWQRIENDFLKFQAKLPEKYMARDDWIRFSNLIDAKQDALTANLMSVNATLERLLERTKQS